MEHTGGDRERLLAWIGLLHAQDAVSEAVDADLRAGAGIPLAWHGVLLHLGRATGGAARMQELARSALLSKSGLTRLIDRMEAAGLVRRAAYDADRRGTLAVLTSQGRRALQRSMPVYVHSLHERFSRHLSDPDVRDLRRVLRRVLEANGHAQDPTCAEARKVRVS